MQLEIISRTDVVNRPAPILFVHGAWHAAWCWENFLPYFAQHGYASYALSLRGHGASEGREGIRWHSAVHGYVDDVAQVVQSLTTPPILVGHSVGGYVVQKFLESHAAPAAVLLASLPVSGSYGFAHRYRQRNLMPFLKAMLLMNPWHMVETPELMKDAFFSPEVPAEDIARHFARLQPDSFRMQFETLFRLPRPARVKTPMLVLAAANDRVFSVAEQQATASAYGTQAQVFPNMAHNMMLEKNWQNVADTILGWLHDRGL